MLPFNNFYGETYRGTEILEISISERGKSAIVIYVNNVSSPHCIPFQERQILIDKWESFEGQFRCVCTGVHRDQI